MIINIRGTNGSGKSTVATGFLGRFPRRERYGCFGTRYPQAYEVDCGLDKYLYVIGPYVSPTGGADVVVGHGFDRLIELVAQYAQVGHVLFEGMAISNSFGSIGEWLLKHKHESIVAFMDTPLRLCLEALSKRQAASSRPGNSAHVAEKYKQILRVRDRMSQAGIRVEDLNRVTGVDTILSWLH